MRLATLLVVALLASPANAYWGGITVGGMVEAIAGDANGVRMTFACKDAMVSFSVTIGLLRPSAQYPEAQLSISADDTPLETLRLTPTRTDKGLLLLTVPSEETALRLAAAALAAKTSFSVAVELGGGNRASTKQSITGGVSAISAVLKACNRPLPG